MTHTEEEAKKRWCPFVQISGTGNPEQGGGFYTNRGGDIVAPKYCRCIASDCMAWQWETAFNDEAVNEMREVWREEPDTEHFADSKHYPAPHGYCGLAGSK